MVYRVLNLLDHGEVEERLAVGTCPTWDKQTAGGDEVSVWINENASLPECAGYVRIAAAALEGTSR